MALTYNFEKIKDYKETVWLPSGEMNPVTHALIFGTMSVGLGSITDKNVEEFAARFRIVEKLHGPFLRDAGGDRFITDEEFVAHIGLVCNVSNETRAKWASRLFVNKSTSITEDYTRWFNRNQKKAAA